MKLSPMESLFVAEYLIDLNGARAAIRAGYSPKHANRMAGKLVKRPRVADAIEIAIEKRRARTQISADRVLLELARVALSDMRSFAKWGPEGITLIDSSELSADDGPCVAEISSTQTIFGENVKVKLHSKESALTTLAKHLGLLVDRVEHDLSKLGDHELIALAKTCSAGAGAPPAERPANGEG